MAHKAMIGGAVYEVGGGKDMIGGAVYEKDHGKTMLGGAVYEVGFGPSTANVKITTPDSNNASFPNVIIDGVNYNDTSVEYELIVPIGTIVELGIAPSVNGTPTSDLTYTIMGDVEIQRYTHITPPSGPPFMPTVTVRLYIIEL